MAVHELPTDRSSERRATQAVVLVISIGYLILAGSLLAAWDLRSSPGVVLIALLAAGLTGTLCADFSSFRATGGGFSIEARRKLRRAAREIQEAVADEEDGSGATAA